MDGGDAFDIVIVGGGINGAGIARDAAGRGLRVLLIERAGLAHYTSSATTKLVHGGLRYLEHFQFRLVRESLTERERLLSIAPHLVSRLRFVLPYKSLLRPAWAVRLGLFLYDRLGGRSTLEPSAVVRFATSEYGLPLRRNIRRGFAYSDCAVDDSRLVVLTAKDAAERGAVVRVGHRLVHAAREQGLWRVDIECEAAQQAYTVSARAIVNASGPWILNVLSKCLGTMSRQSVRLVKGSHIVVRRLYEGDHAYTLQHTDRRLVFVIPYQDHFTLIGTTDVPWQGEPGPAAIAPAETEYLCQTVNRYFERQIGSGDVVWSYAGIRALWDDDASNASAVTRDYVLDIDAAADRAPVLSVFGGKITTYRRLAELALDKLESHLGPLAPGWTLSAPLPGGDIPGGDVNAFADELTRRWPFLDQPQARRLAHAYGTRAARLLDGVDSRELLGEEFGGGMTRVEVDYLVREEWARSAEDIYWRHSKTGLHASPADRQRLAAYLQGATQARPAQATS
ncbi:MAG: glycerol-3-phosphate dehydrogenase [Steroidobacteraceae bacterium]